MQVEPRPLPPGHAEALPPVDAVHAADLDPERNRRREEDEALARAWLFDENRNLLTILQRLRSRLHARDRLPPRATARPETMPHPDSRDGDRYEPQRLGRRITWQYDQEARKVPLLKRPYL